ncbi:hypothetical protein EON79_05925 [bacterium]|nr:MAG: hypothetical protein EON79_05925 [bacterium]
MLAAFAFLLSNEPFRDRDEFNRSFAQVEEGMTKEEVVRILGAPDDEQRPRHRWTGRGDKVWGYGTNEHGSLPTLGRIHLMDGKVLDKPLSITGPIQNLPPEPELRGLLRSLARELDPSLSFDPLGLVHAANLLLPLGKERAIAVMIQYERLIKTGLETESSIRLIRLGQILFGNDLGAEDGEGYLGSVVLVDDIPFLLEKGGIFGGGLPSFEGAAIGDSNRWKMRQSSLRPSDNPFRTFRKAIEIFKRDFPQWGPLGQSRGSSEGVPKRYREQFQSLMALVREIHPDYEKSLFAIPSPSFEALRQSFLRTGARWDPTRSRYVRADGSPIRPFFPEANLQGGSVDSLPKISLDYRFRRTDRETVESRITMYSRGKNDGFDHRIVLADSGEVLLSGESKGDYPNLQMNGELLIPTGARIRIEFSAGGKTFRSRPIRT